MKYFLRKAEIGKSSRLEITEQEFQNINNAKNILTQFISLTEIYRVVVESYRQVENTKHNAELDHILHSKVEYKDHLDTLVALNSAIVGYIASARLFLDSTDKIISKLLPDNSIDSYKDFKRRPCCFPAVRGDRLFSD